MDEEQRESIPQIKKLLNLMKYIKRFVVRKQDSFSRLCLYFLAILQDFKRSFWRKIFHKLYNCGIDFEEELGASMTPVHKVWQGYN